MKLRLEAKTKEQELIKAYLEENVSDILADKINNGARIVKDGAMLLNKKTLDGFMTYAADEARKLAEKGARSICVEDKVVYGWAVHYFEEDSMEEKLYNEDGTEYRPKPKAADKPKSVSPAVKPKPEPQLPLFELMCKPNDTTATEKQTNEAATDDTSNDPELSEDDDVISEDEQREILTEAAAKEERENGKEHSIPAGSPLYRSYLKLQEQYPDCIVAYRVGDFYEVFGERAKLLSETLGLMLTSRDCGLNERVPMVGFPYHAADNYISKAEKHGLKIVIFETLRDLLGNHDREQISPQSLPDLSPTEPVKHWVDDNTYIDEDGVVHSVDNGSDRKLACDMTAYDAGALAVLKDIFGDLLVLR
mgnify:CR=1 FL=1